MSDAPADAGRPLAAIGARVGASRPRGVARPRLLAALAALAGGAVAAIAGAVEAGAATGAAPGAAPPGDLLDRPAIQAPLAARSLLLDVARAGERLVAVGERGHVLLSDDGGRRWRQARSVPSRTMLTAVTFADAQNGWAVGHDEIILRTADGGETWQRQHWAPESQQPLLDVWFADASRGIAIGAYKAYFTTADGGASWSKRAFEPAPAPRRGAPDPDDEFAPEYHLNAIAGAGSRLWIAAEAGQLYRSDDGGENWRTLASPYQGSFFGVLPLDAGSVLAFGLRGNLYRSDDAGESWRRLETGTSAMLTDALALGPDRYALVGLSGTVLLSVDGGSSWTLLQQADRRGLSAALAVDAGALLVVGEEGARRIPLEGDAAPPPAAPAPAAGVTTGGASR